LSDNSFLNNSLMDESYEDKPSAIKRKEKRTFWDMDNDLEGYYDSFGHYRIITNVDKLIEETRNPPFDPYMTPKIEATDTQINDCVTKCYLVNCQCPLEFRSKRDNTRHFYELQDITDPDSLYYSIEKIQPTSESDIYIEFSKEIQIQKIKDYFH